MVSLVQSLFRLRDTHDSHKVVFVELFFDLVFVFAITQLAHSLLYDFSIIGLIKIFIIGLAIWWVWIYTTWVTNWLDPQTTPVRVMLFVQMFAGLFLAIAIPKAFTSSGLLFAASYAFMQISRSLFMCVTSYKHKPTLFIGFVRIMVWLVVASIFWLLGGASGPELRFLCWGLALLIETSAAMAGFWLPFLGKSKSTDWDVSGAHMAERCGLFIIIALGESLLVTGSTFSKLDWDLISLSAFTVAFLGTIAMWWVYFNVGADHAAQKVSECKNPGYIARLAYSYLHIPIVAGIILMAVVDELILKHPLGHAGHTSPITLFALLGGPILFLLGNLLFKRAVFKQYALSHITGIVFLILLVPTYLFLTPIALAFMAMLVLMIVGLWEHTAVKKNRT